MVLFYWKCLFFHIKLVIMSAREPWRNVGRKIRYLRKAHRLTIKQLAVGCDLSPNAISLVERGQVAPTVVTLCKIASALGVPASSLFQEVCPNEVILIRARDYHAAQPASRALDALACGIVPQERPSRPDVHALTAEDEDVLASYSHQSVLCLCGRIEYEVNGDSYQLEPGDSLSINGNAPHRWRNPSSKTAVAVMVIPPKFVQESEEGE